MKLKLIFCEAKSHQSLHFKCMQTGIKYNTGSLVGEFPSIRLQSDLMSN